MVRFFLETSAEGLSSAFMQEITLPRSGLTYVVRRDPIILERNIQQVDLVRVDSGRLALRFQLDAEGKQNLYRASVANRGRALILTINNLPTGARLLDGPIADGVLYTFTELQPSELEEIATELQDNVLLIQELKSENSLLR